MTPGETGGNTIFYFIQPQRGATKIIRSQRRRDAKKLIPKPKNQRIFSAYICVKKNPAIPRGIQTKKGKRISLFYLCFSN